MNELLRVGWEWSPSVVIGFALWTLLYMWSVRSRPTPLGQQIAFHLGTLIGLLALVSPLDELGDLFLFSAHMVQHLLLMFVTAPLWLIGVSGWLVDRIIPKRVELLVYRLTRPMSTFFIFVGVLYFWHIPAVYNLAQESEAIHIFEHLTFIGAALIGWWPVAGAETGRFPKPEPPARMLYLFLLALPCTALAAALTFARTPLYVFYINAPHFFGLDALQDQRLGGLLMWLPTHMVLLLAMGLTFRHWFARSGWKPQREHSMMERHAGSKLTNEIRKIGI
jgi:cytochrome c oxidase assembly factor CtaG